MAAHLYQLQDKAVFTKPDVIVLNRKISELVQRNHALARLQTKGAIDSALISFAQAKSESISQNCAGKTDGIPSGEIRFPICQLFRIAERRRRPARNRSGRSLRYQNNISKLPWRGQFTENQRKTGMWQDSHSDRRKRLEHADDSENPIKWKHMGNVLLQKSFTATFLERQPRKNHFLFCSEKEKLKINLEIFKSIFKNKMAPIFRVSIS